MCAISKDDNRTFCYSIDIKDKEYDSNNTGQFDYQEQNQDVNQLLTARHFYKNNLNFKLKSSN